MFVFLTVVQRLRRDAVAAVVVFSRNSVRKKVLVEVFIAIVVERIATETVGVHENGNICR